MRKGIGFLAVATLLLWPAALHSQAQTSPNKQFLRDPPQPNAARFEPLVNFHQVTRNLYRSAQPRPLQLEGLYHQYGVRNVISLKTTGDDRLIAAGLRMKISRFELPPLPWTSDQIWASKQTLVAALRELGRSVRTAPTLLHCTNGSDRTGLVTALYQILYEGWDKERAIAEMEKPKYDFHKYLQGIPSFIHEVNIAQLRREVGVP